MAKVIINIISPVGVSIVYNNETSESESPLKTDPEFTLGAKAISDDGIVYRYGKASQDFNSGDRVSLDNDGYIVLGVEYTMLHHVRNDECCWVRRNFI